MKAIIQSYKDGQVTVDDVPAPALKPGGVLVQNVSSVVSAGTEKLMMDLARKSLLGKAKERPDLVKKVLDKVRTDGVIATFQTVQSRLDAPIPMGYSSAGIVIEVAEDVLGFKPGDAVACAGAGYASHAGTVFVPQNLCVKIPEMASTSAESSNPSPVPFEQAAFTTLGAIAMQGFRLAEPQLGEVVAVIGLGLLGLICVQIAKAAGCRVIGMDLNPERCTLALGLGCDAVSSSPGEFSSRCKKMTYGHGVDRVLICAATTRNDPVELAGDIARNLGTVIVVGAVGMDIPRAPYFSKELIFRVSRSYGPGRYDAEYEEKGHDYPYGYVRWTENRNMQAIVDLMAQRKLKVAPLISHRFSIDNALDAYRLVSGETREPYLGIVLDYPEGIDALKDHEKGIKASKVTVSFKPERESGDPLSYYPIHVGFLGAGAYAKGTLIPAMKKVKGINYVGVCAATGLKAGHIARKFGFRYFTTREADILGDPDINTVAILTQHDLHARQVIESIKAGKHVFVEKPLCLNRQELNEIMETLSQASDKKPAPKIMVGYNRRFAPLAEKLKSIFNSVDEPLAMSYRINAGYIPADHWTQDLKTGGGRIIGEACHFIDFLTFIAGSLPDTVYAQALPNSERYINDNVVITITFRNGSVGNINYFANGDKSLPKERVEVFGGGVAAVLDNFRALQWHAGGKRKQIRSYYTQNKGQRGEWEYFRDAVKNNRSPGMTLDEMAAVSISSFSIVDSILTSTVMRIDRNDADNNTGTLRL